MTSTNDWLVKSTQDLIDSEPTSIALLRSAWESDGAGGRRRASAPVAQPAKDRFFSGIDTDKSVAYNQLGIRKDRIFVLIGMPGDDIQEGDTFVARGETFRVVWVDDDQRYQTKAECIHGS